MEEEYSPHRVSFIPCVRWVKKGVAKGNPDKIELNKEELEAVLKQTKEEVDDLSEEVNALENDEPVDKENEDVYDLAHYDDEEEDDDDGMKFANIVASASHDSYITYNSDDSDDDDDIIRAEDNLILVAHMQGDASILEVYLYNREEESLYVHHDVFLPSVPLCLEWLNYEPKCDGALGNLCAVGSMSPVIEIWDLDIINCMEACCKLGRKSNKKKGIKGVGHQDAVLDLSWNTNLPHILASGSVDETVILWDLDKALPGSTLNSFSEKVQALKWHPFESHALLAGSCDSLAKVFDCRVDNTFKQWAFDGEVERVLWDKFNPFNFFVGSSVGKVYYLDCRKEDALWQLAAHSSEITGLNQSAQCPGLLTTSSTEGKIKVWDVAGEENSAPVLIYECDQNLGAVHCMDACPDLPFVFCAGGDNKSNNFKVLDLTENASVNKRFSSRPLLQCLSVASESKPQSSLPEPMDTVESTDPFARKHNLKKGQTSTIERK